MAHNGVDAHRREAAVGLGREVRERLDGGRVTDDPAFLHHHARRTAADGVVKFRPAVAAVDATAQYVMGPQIPWKATWVGDSCGGLEASASASVCVRLRGRSKNRRHRALQRVERLNASASTWIARVGLSFRRPALGMSQHRPRRSAEHLGIGSQHPGCGRLRADRGVSGRVWARRRRRCCYVVPRDLRGGGGGGGDGSRRISSATGCRRKPRRAIGHDFGRRSVGAWERSPSAAGRVRRGDVSPHARVFHHDSRGSSLDVRRVAMAMRIGSLGPTPAAAQPKSPRVGRATGP